MPGPSIVLRHLGPGLGALFGLVGLIGQGFEAGVLWSLVGFFLGKSLQSTLWTVSAGRSRTDR